MAKPTQEQWTDDLLGEGLGLDVDGWIHGWGYDGPVGEPGSTKYGLTHFGLEGNLKWEEWVTLARRILEQEAK